MHIQCKTFYNYINLILSKIGENEVQLKNYKSNFAGFIQSWMERFPSADISQTLIELWEKDKQYFRPKNN